MKVINTYIVWYTEGYHIMYETEERLFYIIVNGKILYLETSEAFCLMD